MLVDSHVHLHACFEPAAFLDAASANFARARAGYGLAAGVPGCLLLTESAGVEGFERLADGAASSGPWQVRRCAEPVSLVALRDGDSPIIVVAGRQIVTAESLEVLALGTRATFRDGGPTRPTIEEVVRAGALAVLPWGFGKWTGRRGGLVRAVIEDRPQGPVFVGDNGGRPRLWPRPGLFALAERAGMIVLAGSDPLPFPGEIAKAGRYGLVAAAEPDPDRPFEALRGWLQEQRRSPPVYGTRDAAWTFLDRQIRLQLRKRMRQEAD